MKTLNIRKTEDGYLADCGEHCSWAVHYVTYDSAVVDGIYHYDNHVWKRNDLDLDKLCHDNDIELRVVDDSEDGKYLIRTWEEGGVTYDIYLENTLGVIENWRVTTEAWIEDVPFPIFKEEESLDTANFELIKEEVTGTLALLKKAGVWCPTEEVV